MSRSNMPSSENINKPRSYSERSHTSLSDSPRLGVSNSSRPGANRKRAPQTRKTVNWRVVSGLTLLLLVIPYIVISLAFSQSSGALGNAVANCLGRYIMLSTKFIANARNIYLSFAISIIAINIVPNTIL